MASHAFSSVHSQGPMLLETECSSRLIEHVVRCLTTERDTSSCVLREYVKSYWDLLAESVWARETFPSEQVQRMEQEIEEWELFHDSQIQTRKPSDLRVCYLGESNLRNDLELFLQNGVLCQNIWAVAKNSKGVAEVWKSINQSTLRNVRLIPGDFLNFLEECEERFDIIYFDACASLPAAKQNTLKVIGRVFYYNKLTSPGALITVFSFPPKQPVENEYASESELSMGPAQRNASNSDLLDKETNKPMFLFEQYLRYRDLLCGAKSLTARNDEEKYSDYITYQVIDSASLFIPVERMLSSTRKSVWDEIFVNRDDFLDEILLSFLKESFDVNSQAKETGKSHEEQSIAPGKPSTIKTVWDHTAGKSPLQKLGSVLKSAEKSNSLCKTWVDEIFHDWRTSCLQKHDISLLLLTPLLFSSHEFFFSYSNSDFKRTCLDPISQCFPESVKSDSLCNKATAFCAGCMVANLLYGQLANPSFPVIDKLLRLRYTSNGRQIFSDGFIFDKCGYLYDPFPTVGCACHSISELNQQMVYRMVLDGLRKHLASICNVLFQFCDQIGGEVTSCYDLLGLPERQVLEGRGLLEGKAEPSNEGALRLNPVEVDELQTNEASTKEL